MDKDNTDVLVKKVQEVALHTVKIQKDHAESI